MSARYDWQAERGDEDDWQEYARWCDERDDDERLRRLEKDGVEA